MARTRGYFVGLFMLVACGSGQPSTSAADGNDNGGSSTAGAEMGSPPTSGGSTATGMSGTDGTTVGTAETTAATGGGDEPAEPYPFPAVVPDEDGSALWLRYPEVPLEGLKSEYRAAFVSVVNTGTSDRLAAATAELVTGLSGLLGQAVSTTTAPAPGAVVLGTVGTTAIDGFGLTDRVASLGPEGYLVESVPQANGTVTVVVGNSDIGVLYGAFALLRHLQSHDSAAGLSLSGSPRIRHRVLNHWDNLDGTVERGYAGASIWDWDTLPGTISQRYVDYARANASIGINGTVLTNVNATRGNNADMWADGTRAANLQKVQALADAFRPYGIRVYLTAPFNAAGNANPNDPATRAWWADRLDEIYALIPDFGGLLIKASSEGEPGPSNGATHADGANMLAAAVGDRGIVMWRAFVYAENLASDRVRQAFDEFGPLDGQFADNVFVQTKNGPLDFQPREPIHPIFGGMPATKVALELQITKEYLGQDTHLAYLGPLYEEVLQTDTLATGAGSTLARIVDGTVFGSQDSAIAGVSNVGDDVDWTGSHFNQANWYAYGRMAWDPDLSARVVAEEWVRQTFSNDPALVVPVVELMMSSHPTLVNYMTPLGLVHIMGTDHHYGPAPWVDNLERGEWNPFYYHEAAADGIGIDRTATGTNAIAQYPAAMQLQYVDRSTISDDFLLYFHRGGWSDPMATGRTLWEELVHRYSTGVDGVQTLRDQWLAAEGRIDARRFAEVSEFLQIQHFEARWWRDACLTYFAQVGGNLPIPAGYAPPANSLAFYQQLHDQGTCPPDPTKPRCEAIYAGAPSPAVLP